MMTSSSVLGRFRLTQQQEAVQSGVPAGLTWLADTRHGLDIYSKGFVKTPTIFFDPSASTSLGLGTYNNPYTTQAQLQTVISGNMAKHVLGFKRGTTLRVTGTNGLSLSINGTSADPFVICPYGDAVDLPKITGGAFFKWGVHNAALNIWQAAIGSTEHDVWQSDVRLLKVAFSVSASSTLTADGTSTFSSGVLYIRPNGGINPNSTGTVEVSVVDHVLNVTYSDVSATGYIHLAGLDFSKSRDNCVQFGQGSSVASITTADDVSIVGCKSANVGVDKTGTGLGMDCFLVYGVSDAIRLTNLYVAGNYATDTLNNAYEFAATTGLIHEHNKAYKTGGHGICELWSSNDLARVRYNQADYMSSIGHILAVSPSGMWFANNFESGGTFGNNDATNLKNANNWAYFNLITRAQANGVIFAGGTGHKFQQNTVIVDSREFDAAETTNAQGWRTTGTGATGFVDISNNMFYWVNVDKVGSERYVDLTTAPDIGASVPSGNNNVYFYGFDNGGQFHYEPTFSTNFTAYKTALSGFSLDQNSLCSNKNTGGTLTAASLGMAESGNNQWRPIASAVAGLTTLTGLGTRYFSGAPYDAATAVIGAFPGT